jgi:protoheme IX farnesyltransferase
LLLAIVSGLPWALGYVGVLYGVAACLLSLGFVACSWRVLRDQRDSTGVSFDGDVPARLNFRYSLLYLAGIFLALAADKSLGWH